MEVGNCVTSPLISCVLALGAPGDRGRRPAMRRWHLRAPYDGGFVGCLPIMPPSILWSCARKRRQTPLVQPNRSNHDTSIGRWSADKDHIARDRTHGVRGPASPVVGLQNSHGLSERRAETLEFCRTRTWLAQSLLGKAMRRGYTNRLEIRNLHLR